LTAIIIWENETIECNYSAILYIQYTFLQTTTKDKYQIGKENVEESHHTNELNNINPNKP
jgi:hypothetical protein